jgi:FMN phosphatase YigB (HAD superfamily)
LAVRAGEAMKLEALVFDAYGTLFDVHSVGARCEQFWPGKGAARRHSQEPRRAAGAAARLSRA